MNKTINPFTWRCYMLVSFIPHSVLCQGLISEPVKVLNKISTLTGGTASVDDRCIITVAEPDMSLMTLTEIRERFVSSTIHSWEAMRVID